MATQTKKTAVKKPVKTPEPETKPRLKVRIREGSLLKDVAEKLKLKPRDVVEKLSGRNYILSASDMADAQITDALAKITGFELEYVSLEEDGRFEAGSRTADLMPKPPVVTIMGHVDHGKTTLLDSIRSSHLVDKESGGITQHIGAYRVTFKNRPITFVDTPGHEAFTQLRARGAKVTDIVVLVVAADDGVMPQTKEAINHAKAAGVPIIVAINKIDRAEANIERVKQQLSKEGLLVEEWGGKTISVEISAKDKKNLDELLEMILLLGDVVELRSNPKVAAQGVVLEARLDAQKGPVATVIIQQGTLTSGQAFISGTSFGRARALFDEKGKPMKSAGPSVPVEILGFNDVPAAGNLFQVVPDLDLAKRVAEHRLSKIKKDDPSRSEHVTLDDLFKKIDEGQVKELSVILKADVQGSVEVLSEIIPTMGTEKVKIRLVQASTGNITEADVLLASASNAIVIGYNTKAAPAILEMAEEEDVEIRLYKIIYQLTEDLKKAVIGMLEPVIRETFLGRAEVRKVFEIPKVGVIAGCYVQDGRILRNSEARVLRNKTVVYQGRVSSLKHLKENVSEVKKDYECGIGMDKFHEFAAGDIIEAFVKEKVKAE